MFQSFLLQINSCFQLNFEHYEQALVMFDLLKKILTLLNFVWIEKNLYWLIFQEPLYDNHNFFLGSHLWRMTDYLFFATLFYLTLFYLKKYDFRGLSNSQFV